MKATLFHRNLTLKDTPFLAVLFLFLFNEGTAQSNHEKLDVPVLKNEYWWGGAVADGEVMPYSIGFSVNLFGDTKANQAQPLLLSNTGRVLWSEKPIRFRFRNDTLHVESSEKIKLNQSGTTLKDAFLFASKNYFPPSGKIPDALLFSKPQYNTWIELTYNQNQQDILTYAHAIVSNDFPPGVFMIDDNWQQDYGVWNFRADRFSNPKEMVDELHRAGFKVMLWVCPFVSPDSEMYRQLAAQGVLIKERNSNDPLIVRWWNGASAVLDFSNPAAVKWFKNQLDTLMRTYGIDGFKFDAGDANFYKGEMKTFKNNIEPNEHAELFARIGLNYTLNEYRSGWKMAGQPLAQRLADKQHSWEDLQKLIPQILAQGLIGYSFICPDMIGGGEFTSFINLTAIDQDLVVRSAQCHAFMPMMQFSVAPWRILDATNLSAVKKAVAVRSEFADQILQLALSSSKTGEPIVRSMEYVFPLQGFEKVTGQFMLGDDVLVAPVTQMDNRKEIFIPKGKWKSDEGIVIRGPKKINVTVAMDRIPYFKRIN